MTLNPSMNCRDYCSRINAELRRLRYHYAESAGTQMLEVEQLGQVFFNPSAGGAVGGGSGRWVRSKHQESRIHEPGAIAALIALRAMEYPVAEVLDVGALYGYFSFLSAASFAHAQVLALEMNPVSYAALRKNIDVNPSEVGRRITPIHCAISDRTEKAKPVHIENFTLRDQHASFGQRIVGFLKNWLGVIYFQNLSYQRSMESAIDFWTLDDLCQQRGLRPGLVKIDVEGYQSQIIPGALRMLAEARPIVMLEFDSPEAVNASSRSNKDIVQPLFDLGYSLIWGRHRDPNAEFEHVAFADMDQRHETNSLGVFVP